MKKKISCPDFAFPLLEHDKVLRLAEMLGMQGVDIGLFQDRSHLQPFDVFPALERNAKELKSKTDALGLQVSDVFIQGDLDFHVLSCNHPDEAERKKSDELFERTLEFAKIVGAAHVTGLPGCAYPEQEAFEASWERCVEAQRRRVEKAKEYGIPYGCEAHVDSICEVPADAKKLCDESGMRLTLDYSHFVRRGRADTEGDILIPYATHFHLRGANREYLQIDMKDNSIDFERILPKLDEAGYDGWICAEYCWTPNWENSYLNDNVENIIMVRDLVARLI